MKQKQQELKRLKEILSEKKRIRNTNNKNASRLVSEHADCLRKEEIYELDIKSLEDQIAKIQKEIEQSSYNIIKVYRIIPVNSSCIYIYLFKNESEGYHYANNLWYEDMDEEFKSIIPLGYFTRAFLQPDLLYLYWVSPEKKLIRRNAYELF